MIGSVRKENRHPGGCLPVLAQRHGHRHASATPFFVPIQRAWVFLLFGEVRHEGAGDPPGNPQENPRGYPEKSSCSTCCIGVRPGPSWQGNGRATQGHGDWMEKTGNRE